MQVSAFVVLSVFTEVADVELIVSHSNGELTVYTVHVGNSNPGALSSSVEESV